MTGRELGLLSGYNFHDRRLDQIYQYLGSCISFWIPSVVTFNSLLYYANRESYHNLNDRFYSHMTFRLSMKRKQKKSEVLSSWTNKYNTVCPWKDENDTFIISLFTTTKRSNQDHQGYCYSISDCRCAKGGIFHYFEQQCLAVGEVKQTWLPYLS
jgi:hypothetical protein